MDLNPPTRVVVIFQDARKIAILNKKDTLATTLKYLQKIHQIPEHSSIFLWSPTLRASIDDLDVILPNDELEIKLQPEAPLRPLGNQEIARHINNGN